MGAQPFPVGAHDRRDCRQMKASLDAVERPLDSPRVGNVSVNEIDHRRQVVTVPAREIIEHPHCVTLVQQCVYQMRTQEPGTAGHEKASHPTSLKSSFDSSNINKSCNEYRCR